MDENRYFINKTKTFFYSIYDYDIRFYRIANDIDNYIFGMNTYPMKPIDFLKNVHSFEEGWDTTYS
jgi:hypothetical protein